MIDKKSSVQLELFSRSDESVVRQQPGASSFFTNVRSYEKVIVAVIIIGVISIISFSFGVERGKRIAVASLPSPVVPVSPETTKRDVAPAAVAITTAAPAMQPAQIASVSAKPAAVSATTSLKKGPFAIQLASYTAKAAAQREADSLKKKGFNSVLLTKGKYIVLYITNFQSRESAAAVLADLEKKYKGCAIRRL